MNLRNVFLGFALVLLVACQKTAPDPAITAAKASYFPAEVVVVKSTNFHTGLKLITKEDPNALADRFATETQARIAAELGVFMRGTKPAKITILLQAVSVASSAGRVLLASDSVVSGTVTIKDSETGTVVAARNIEAIDRAAKGRGNIGFVVSLVANAASSSEEKRIGRLREAFVVEVRKWITGK